MMRMFVAALLGLTLSQAAAQPAPPASQPSPEERFAEAKARYNVREYEQALAIFKELYLASNEPALLLNMGQCYRQLGQAKEASELLRAYLREAPDSPYREEVERILAQLSSEPARPTSAPSSLPATTPSTLPAPVGRAGTYLLTADGALLGAFTGVTAAFFLSRVEGLDNAGPFVVGPALGAAGGAALGYIYGAGPRRGARSARQAHPVSAGLFLGALEGLSSVALFNVDQLGAQAVISGTWFTTAAGAVAGVAVAELRAPSPGDSLLTSAAALGGGLLLWGATEAIGLRDAQPLGISGETAQDLLVSGGFHAGLLAGLIAGYYRDLPARAVWRQSAWTIGGALLGGVAGGLLGAEGARAQPLAAGATVGGLAGTAAGLLLR